MWPDQVVRVLDTIIRRLLTDHFSFDVLFFFALNVFGNHFHMFDLRFGKNYLSIMDNELSWLPLLGQPLILRIRRSK